MNDVPVPSAKVVLSTSSCYPESCASAFDTAARLGYDGVEIMVWTDPVSQDADAIDRLSRAYGLPVLSVHAPTLLVTQRVWGLEPWTKLHRSRELAMRVGASTIVVHPPFRWQREYARSFVQGIAGLNAEGGVTFAVENMYPWRARGREVQAYAPGWDPLEQDYEAVCVDLSHSATAQVDGLGLVKDLGDRMSHLHLADGSGEGSKDEHLVPGRGTQPCAEVLAHLGSTGFTGTVVVEVSTRRAASRVEREALLAESLAFARANLAGTGTSG